MGIESAPQQNLEIPTLVQPLQPAVNTPAVANLVEAFRNGFVTSQDIMDRIGKVGQAKQKAELTSFNEFTSPESTAARKATVQAAGARANLDTAQASAAGPLVQPQAALQAQEIARKQADMKWGGGVAAYQQYAPYFGQPGLIQGADGQPDYDAMGQKGNDYMRTMAQQNFARMMLEPDPARKITGTNAQQQPFEKWFNKWGQDVTPSADNPTFQHYNSIIQHTNQQIFGQPGSVQAAPTAPPMAAPAAPAAPLVQPKPIDEQRADLVNSGRVPIAQAVNLTPEQITQMSAAPAAPAAAPLVQPAAAPAPVAKPNVSVVGNPVGSYSQESGMVTGPGKNVMSAKEIADDLRKQKAYELWDSQKGFAETFKDTANRIQQIPVEEQRSGKVPMNALDLALAESIIKMYDPAGAIREFKWDKLADAQPVLEKLPNWKSSFLHTGTLTPEGRTRLIEMGYENVAGKEKAVQSHLQQAAKRAEASGLSPSDVLNPEEIRVLEGGSFKGTAGGPTGNPPGVSGQKTGTVPGIGTGVFDPKTGIFTVTQ